MTNTKKFITIEGIDGSGKSTFIPKIQKMLEDLGEEVILTREPGGTPLAEEFRPFLLERKMNRMSEVLLAFVARNEHIQDVIKPNLEEGKFVISDRFTDSTLAYQGYGRGVPLENIQLLSQMVQQEIVPELTLIFTVPVEVSKARLAKTGKVPDKFESQESDFFLRAIEGYEAIAKTNPERYKLIDSSQGIEHTAKQVNKHMKEYLEKINQVNSKKIKP